MTIKVSFQCDGCDKKAEGTAYLQRRFISVTGKSHGLGQYHFDGVPDVKPEGWMDFDPYTGCCYCPRCWEEIDAVREERKEKNPGASSDTTGV